MNIRDIVREHNYEKTRVYAVLKEMDVKLPKGWTLKQYAAGACLNWQKKDMSEQLERV